MMGLGYDLRKFGAVGGPPASGNCTAHNNSADDRSSVFKFDTLVHYVSSKTAKL